MLDKDSWKSEKEKLEICFWNDSELKGKWWELNKNKIRKKERKKERMKENLTRKEKFEKKEKRKTS